MTNTQKVNSDAQIEKMEKELAKMRAGLDESVQLMEQREMNTNIEYVTFSTRLVPLFGCGVLGQWVADQEQV